MISTEWGHPRCFFKGLDLKDVEERNYGTHLNVYDWKQRKITQKIDLGLEGIMPLEIRSSAAIFVNYFIFISISLKSSSLF